MANWEKRLEALLDKADEIEEVIESYRLVLVNPQQDMHLRRRASHCMGRALLTREITRGKVREARTRVLQLKAQVGNE